MSTSHKFKIGDKVRITKIQRLEDAAKVYKVKDIFTHHVDGTLINLEGYLGFLRPYELEHEPFTKSDLKDGMRVETRAGKACWLCGGSFIYHDHYAHWRAMGCLYNYNEDLLSHYKAFDIIRVTDRDGTVLFEREPEVNEYTMQELADKLGVDVKSLKIKGE